MKNWIVKSNRWYDNLPDTKRFLFFLFVVMGSYTVVQLVIVPYCILAFPIWVLLLMSWRMSYIFLKH